MLWKKKVSGAILKQMGKIKREEMINDRKIILKLVEIKEQFVLMEIFYITTLIISKKPGNTGISRDIRTEFTTDLLLSD